MASKTTLSLIPLASNCSLTIFNLKEVYLSGGVGAIFWPWLIIKEEAPKKNKVRKTTSLLIVAFCF